MEQKSTYASLKIQIDRLQAEANAILQTERAEVVGRIKEAISVYALTAKDLGLGKQLRKIAKVRIPRGNASAAPAKQLKPKIKKYADGAGNEWDGRGEQPAWVKQELERGRALSDLVVKPSRRAKKA